MNYTLIQHQSAPALVTMPNFSISLHADLRIIRVLENYVPKDKNDITGVWVELGFGNETLQRIGK